MYDPLVDSCPPSNEQYPDSYWASINDREKHTNDCPPLQGHQQTEVVIVGAGYTGLSCALHLAENYGVECTIIEANQPGWGCSGRNGGFVLPGTGRLSVQQMSKRWGKGTSQAVYTEYLQSISTVEHFIEAGIDCQQTKGGYLKLAHKPALVAPLHEQAIALSEDYGDSIISLTSTQIQTDYLSGTPSFGGIYYPNAFGINPWLFCQGLAKRALQAGVKIYGNSAVEKTERKHNKHILNTESGSISANTLVMATNGYGQRDIYSGMVDRTFPVVSSIIVTEPLSPMQIEQIGMRAGLMVMDTRALKFYYRVLPDKRLLFGGRGAVYGKNAGDNKYLEALKDGLLNTFPSLGEIGISHFWSGWVSVSIDDYPRIYHNKTDNTLYSAGYCGAGLAFSVQAGKRLAQLLIEPDTLPDLPYWKSPLSRFPLASLRRPALNAFYYWEGLKKKINN